MHSGLIGEETKGASPPGQLKMKEKSVYCSPSPRPLPQERENGRPSSCWRKVRVFGGATKCDKFWRWGERNGPYYRNLSESIGIFRGGGGATGGGKSKVPRPKSKITQIRARNMERRTPNAKEEAEGLSRFVPLCNGLYRLNSLNGQGGRLKVQIRSKTSETVALN